MRALTLCLFAATVAVAAADCDHYNDCLSCAGARGWTGQCRWCPKQSGNNACHDPGSLYNKCDMGANIINVMNCPAGPSPAPAPAPAPAPTTIIDPAAMLQKLFDLLKLNGADAKTCVKDVGSAGMHLRDFAAAASHKNATVAVKELAAALTSLASSVNDCQVPELQAKFDALAARLHMANVTKGVDGVVKVMVGASEVWLDLVAVGTAVQSKDPAAVAAALAKLEGDWSAITGGCASGGEACKLVDGALKILGIVADDLSGACATDLEGAVAGLKAGAAAFEGKNYTGGVKLMAGGLDLFAKAVGGDACNLKGVAAVVASVAPKLEAAIVKEIGGAVSVIVGSADVFDELYQAAMALSRGDLVTFGEQIGLLLQRLRASGCTSKACDVLEGLLAALQLEAGDYSKCYADIDASFEKFVSGVSALEAKEWTTGVADLGVGLEGLAHAVSGCGIPQLATILENVATKLGAATVATAIGKAEQVLVDGADIIDDLAQAQADWGAKNYAAFGADLGQLAQDVSATGCKSWVCKLAQGILSQFDIYFSDLTKCEADITVAMANFTNGANLWTSKNYGGAVTDFAAGLNIVAKAVTDCGIKQELDSLQHEANVLGIANITGLGDIANIIVHGADFYENLYAFIQNLEKHDYRAAGQEAGNVLNQLSQWTSKHACTSDLCYVVTGVIEFMGDIQGSIKTCEKDFTTMWGNFTAAFHDFTDEKSIVWEFEHDIPKIKKAVGEVGVAFGEMASAVSDCHLEQLAEVLAAVAAKLGLSPEVQIVEEILKIFIEGVQIEQEVSTACIDYSNSNWVGFGYNLAKLLKTLL